MLGKLAFVSLEDDSGQIQVYVDKKQLDAGEAEAFKCVLEGLGREASPQISQLCSKVRSSDQGLASISCRSVVLLSLHDIGIVYHHCSLWLSWLSLILLPISAMLLPHGGCLSTGYLVASQLSSVCSRKACDSLSGLHRGLKANLDIGDIIGVQGGIRRTDRGELSVTADTLQVCCSC